MENTKPVIESTDEMEDSPKDNDDCKNAFQDESEKSSRDATTLGNQVLLSVQQETLENRQLPSDISSETPLPSVPTPTPTSQTLDSDELDEIFSNKDVFYSSRKLRIRTKCSRGVDAVLTNRQHLSASKYCSQESERNIATLGNQLLPSLGQETSENQQVPPSISSETCSQPSVSTISSSSSAQDINPLDETSSNDDAFYSSRDLRIRTNYSRSLDALLSPRHNRLGIIDVRLSPRQSFMPILEQFDVCDKIDRKDRSPSEECRDIKMASPPELFTVRITRSLSKKLKIMSTLYPEKRSVEKDMGPTSAKKRRTESPEIDSDQRGSKIDLFRSKMASSVATKTRDMSPVDVQTRETTAAAREGNASETLERPETPKKRKREVMESSCDSNNALESNLSLTTFTAKTDLKSPVLQTLESKESVRKLGESESAIEGKTLIFSRGFSTDSDSSANHSDSQSTDIPTTSTLHLDIFTDISSCSPNRDSGKRSKRSSPLKRWIVSPESKKESESLKLILIHEASSSNLEPISNARISETEVCQPCAEVKKADEFSPASSVVTQSTSDMAHSTTEIQIMESSQSRPMLENPDSPSKICASGMERREFITCPSSRVISNSQMSERSSSENFYIPYRILESEALSEKGGTDRNASDSSSVSEPKVKSELKSKNSTSASLEMLKRSASRNISEIQDPDKPMQEHHRDSLQRQHLSSNSTEALRSRERTEVGMDLDAPYIDVHERQPSTLSYQPVISDGSAMQEHHRVPLQRQHLGSISTEASRSRERTEVGMDLDAPYIDVHEGQPSTSSYQPVTAAGSAGNRLSSSGVTASGEERSGTIKSNSSDQRISKYVLNAQKLLLTVLEELMIFNDDGNLYKRFSHLFHRISKYSCEDSRLYLGLEMELYYQQMETGLQLQYLFRSYVPGFEVQAVYNSLIRKVITTLCFTRSVEMSLRFDDIKTEYERVKILYEDCLEALRNDNEAIRTEDSGSHGTVLKEMIQRLLLQTRNAYRELLMHVGEHADSRFVDSFEEILWEEDKCFLRRRFL